MTYSPTKYDQVAYPSYPQPQTHPDRLAVLGSLFGLRPTPVQNCRVLELGCGNGANLAPMAYCLPKSEFAGIDLAGGPIRQGQQMAHALQLSNLRLVHGDLGMIDATWGEFDYIITHGVYSWVSPEVRTRLLEVCRARLAPQGIAFISYNTLPGCHLRLMLREMMLFHITGVQDPEEQVRQAMALVELLATAQETPDQYRLWMKAELEQLNQHSPGQLYHDELAPINEPLYFTQFIQQASRHGLQFLAEADFFEMSDQAFGDSVRQALLPLAQNRLLREQYLDFLKCRRFRQTLLCRQELPIKSAAQIDGIERFLISSPASPEIAAPDLRPGVNCKFATPKGIQCQTDLPLGKAALAILAKSWPAPLPFPTLLEQAMRELDQQGIPTEPMELSALALRNFLLRVYEGGAVEFRTFWPPVALHAGQRPMAHPLARWQAAHDSSVVSLFHIAVTLQDEIGRSLLQWLDGTLDRAALVEKLWAFLKANNALVVTAGNEESARRDLRDKLEKNLEKLARLGLLVN